MDAQLTATFLWTGGVIGEVTIDGEVVATVQLSAQEEAEACLAPWVGGGMAVGALRKKALQAMEKEGEA